MTAPDQDSARAAVEANAITLAEYIELAEAMRWPPRTAAAANTTQQGAAAASPGPENRRAGLTKIQRKVLEFIRAHNLQNGFSPKYEVIAEHIGVSNRSAVHRHIQCLVDRGALTRLPRQRCSLAVVGGNSLTITLPPELDREVRAIAKHLGITPEAVIIEAARDAFASVAENVSRETGEANCAPSAPTG